MYGVDGERQLDEQVLDHLQGYEGARPVRIVRLAGDTFFARLRRKLGWGGLAERDSS